MTYGCVLFRMDSLRGSEILSDVMDDEVMR